MEGFGVCCVGLMCFPFCYVWIVAVVKIRPKRFWLWVGASVPVYFVTVLCSAAVIAFFTTLPAVLFQESFGFAPTPDIKILNSHQGMPTDWLETYLEFHADQVSVDRILRNGFAPISEEDIIEQGMAPSWWTPPTGSGIEIYATGTDDPGFHGDFHFAFSHQLLIYDPQTKTVYYRHVR